MRNPSDQREPKQDRKQNRGASRRQQRLCIKEKPAAVEVPRNNQQRPKSWQTFPLLAQKRGHPNPISRRVSGADSESRAWQRKTEAQSIGTSRRTRRLFEAGSISRRAAPFRSFEALLHFCWKHCSFAAELPATVLKQHKFRIVVRRTAFEHRI